MLRVLNVRVENYQGAIEVEFQPARAGATLLAGKNEQGKSSTIGAIVSTIGGKDELAAEPVTHGAKKSKTRIDLGEEFLEFRVEQEITADGRKLTVKDAEGVPQRSPQALLDSFFSKIAFDPLEFCRAKPTEQDKTLKQLAGVAEPFAKLEGQAAGIYEKRTVKNREVKTAKVKFEAMPYHLKAPAAEVSVAELAKQLAARQEHAHKRQAAESELVIYERGVAEKLAAIEEARQALAAAEEFYRSAVSAFDLKKQQLEAMAPAEDTTELQQQLETAEATNKLVRENQARAAAERELENLESEAEALTEQLEDIAAQKQAILTAAKFPVEGLGFSDLGPTLHGIPLEQCSSARTLELAYAVGVAQHPKLKLLIIREGAFFDEEALAALDERAQRDGVQVLVERVGTRDTASQVVIIEKGRVAHATAAE